MNNFACLFDMDGVIVDNSDYHKQALKDFSEKYNAKLSEAEFEDKFLGRTNKDWITNFFGADLSEAKIEEYAQEKEKMYRDLYQPHFKLVSGLTEFLQELKEHKIKTSVATSAPPINAKFTLENGNITEYFNFVVDDTQITNSKPDPEIYLKAAKKCEQNIKSCIVFEDSMSGIEAGIRAGAYTIALATTHKKSELQNTKAHLIINDFNELNVAKLTELLKTKV
jgi:HAD superfamily hydrolase (TIGR01509 family)